MALLHPLLPRGQVENWLLSSPALPVARGRFHTSKATARSRAATPLRLRHCCFEGVRVPLKEKSRLFSGNSSSVRGDEETEEEEEFHVFARNSLMIRQEENAEEDETTNDDDGRGRDARLAQGRYLPLSFKKEQDRRPGHLKPRERGGESSLGRHVAGRNGNSALEMKFTSTQERGNPRASETESYSGEWRGKDTWKSGIRSRNSNSSSQTIIQQQAPPQLVSDSSIQQSLYDQLSSPPVPSGRDFIRGNPLVERLKGMEEEIENYCSGEKDDFQAAPRNKIHSKRIRNTANLERPRDRYSEMGEQFTIDRVAGKLGSIQGSRQIFESDRRIAEEPNSSRNDNGVPLIKTFPWENSGTESTDLGNDLPLSRVRAPWVAELTIPEEELKRLRSLAIQVMYRIKVGTEGISKVIVDLIHSEWRHSEVVRVQCRGAAAQNMKRTHEALEERTGGLVVWRSGVAFLVYRGKNYVPPPVKSLQHESEQLAGTLASQREEIKGRVEDNATDRMEESSPQTREEGAAVPRVCDIYDVELDREMEELLSTIGPRYKHWTGGNPVPVDGDFLHNPNMIFKKPARLGADGVQQSLTDLEIAEWRRLARPVPPTFVLGTHKGLDGMAAAICKLWDRHEIVKIALKSGVKHINHEKMGKLLKYLTGGILLSRDKYFIILYRGKDFLSSSVSVPAKNRQALISSGGILPAQMKGAVSLKKLQNIHEDPEINGQTQSSFQIRQIQKSIAITSARKSRAALQLAKVNKIVKLQSPPVERETVTEEERHMLRRLGSKMHSFLLLGRRGVFGGTIENMHLHWKHKDLVKIIYKAKSWVDLEQTARMLEYESGGVLVGTIPSFKGQSIIMYRGKNYQRPSELRPRNLLNKRQAYQRSIEMQRQKTLEKHLLDLEKDLGCLEGDLTKLCEEHQERSSGSTAGIPGDYLPEEVMKSETVPGSMKAKEYEGQMSKEKDQDTANDHDRVIADGPDQVITNEHDKIPKEPQDLLADKRDEAIVQEQDRALSNGLARNEDHLGNVDAIFRAAPLSRRERLLLRQQALKGGLRRRAPHFTVGHSNVIAGLARAIRMRFRKRPLVQVCVKGRAKGTPVEEVLYQLEEATGGTLVSRENSKIILYRGWPEGQVKPTAGVGHWEEISPRLRNAMIAEEEVDEGYLLESERDGYEGEGEVDEDEGEMDEDDDEVDEDNGEDNLQLEALT